MDVSVIVTTYNQVHRLRLVLIALQRQTFSQDRFEVIVVNNGCLDETKAMLEGAQMPNLRLIHLDRNEGRCPARNSGIKHSRGELVIFLDGDALPHPQLVEMYWNSYCELGGEIFFCGYLYSLPNLEHLKDPSRPSVEKSNLSSVMEDYLQKRLNELLVTEALLETDFERLHSRQVSQGF